MKITVTESMFIQEFQAYDRGHHFSRAALEALYEHFTSAETCGYEMELDVIAICGEYDEYATARDACGDCISDDEPELWPEEDALEWLMERTGVIQFDGGIIVQRF